MKRFARTERKRVSSLADLKQDSLPNKLEEEGGAKKRHRAVSSTSSLCEIFFFPVFKFFKSSHTTQLLEDEKKCTSLLLSHRKTHFLKPHIHCCPAPTILAVWGLPGQKCQIWGITGREETLKQDAPPLYPLSRYQNLPAQTSSFLPQTLSQQNLCGKTPRSSFSWQHQSAWLMMSSKGGRC